MADSLSGRLFSIFFPTDRSAPPQFRSVDKWYRSQRSRCLRVLDPPELHPHFTRLQHARGVTKPNMRSLFDKVLKRIDYLRADSGDRWERWERRFEEASAELQERNTAVDQRIASLEEFASAQYTTAVVSDNWDAHFDERVSDLEQRMVDLELICIQEINNERDDRVAVVETAVEEIVNWHPKVDGYIDDLRLEVKRLWVREGGTVMEFPPTGHQRQPELVAARSSAGTPTD